jgi:hypothetical protein
LLHREFGKRLASPPQKVAESASPEPVAPLAREPA